jgi:uncharacterized membrane-anchored protein
MEPLISTLIFVVVVVLLVWAALYISARTLPADVQFPVKIVVGVIGLIAILYRLLPMVGVHLG